MRFCVISLMALVLGFLAPTPSRGNGEMDWGTWRRLPVQHQGRHKPLDTLARESLRALCNRSSLQDPETKEKLVAIEAYLVMLFDWQGWDHDEKASLLQVMDWRAHYSRLHEADKWDQAPLLRVDFLRLRAMLDLEKGNAHVSPDQLSQSWIVDPRTERRMPFPAWGVSLLRLKEDELTELDKKSLELADRLWAYQEHRMGRRLEVLPVQGSQDGQWMSVAHLMLTQFDDTTDPEGDLRGAQKLLWEARVAYHANDSERFHRVSSDLLASFAELGSRVGTYPDLSRVSLEVAYNRGAPFRIAWISMLLALIALLLCLGSGWKSFYLSGLSAYTVAIIALVVGFAMRVAISGRAPVTNMYESVIYVGSGVAVLGLAFELIYRRKYVLAASAAVSTLALLLADHCPAVLDSSLRPLEPVLRSNFWLVTHVMTITLSYAAFALALGIANVTLGYFLLGSTNLSAITALSRFTYKALQVGVLLLAAGVILGGVWADYSWGRFWGWDPKEVWALIALLGYIAVLHARFAGWVGHRGLAFLSVACFSLVVMAWYGVNFVLGAGLHSYGFGVGGQGYVYSTVALQLAYAGIAVMRKPEFDFRPSAAIGCELAEEVPKAA